LNTPPVVPDVQLPVTQSSNFAPAAASWPVFVEEAGVFVAVDQDWQEYEISEDSDDYHSVASDCATEDAGHEATAFVLIRKKRRFFRRAGKGSKGKGSKGSKTVRTFRKKTTKGTFFMSWDETSGAQQETFVALTDRNAANSDAIPAGWDPAKWLARSKCLGCGSRWHRDCRGNSKGGKGSKGSKGSSGHKGSPHTGKGAGGKHAFTTFVLASALSSAFVCPGSAQSFDLQCQPCQFSTEPVFNFEHQLEPNFPCHDLSSSAAVLNAEFFFHDLSSSAPVLNAETFHDCEEGMTLFFDHTTHMFFDCLDCGVPLAKPCLNASQCKQHHFFGALSAHQVERARRSKLKATCLTCCKLKTRAQRTRQIVLCHLVFPSQPQTLLQRGLV